MTALDDDLRSWASALRALTDTPDKAAQFRDVRTQFAVMVAQEVINTTRINTIPVVYGVWLDGHLEPTYIGQTMDAGRRLWDLPIGESHHLANTYPPEVWGRIIVVRWKDILLEDPSLETALTTELRNLGHDDTQSTRVIGLMLEHRLQHRFQPSFNMAKRNSRAGGWRVVDHTVSRSLGAMRSNSVDLLYTRVLDVWCRLAEDGALRQRSIRHSFGGVVFPSSIWRTRFVSEHGVIESGR